MFLHVLPQQQYKASEPSCPHTQTDTHKLIFPTTLYAMTGKLTGQQIVAVALLGR